MKDSPKDKDFCDRSFWERRLKEHGTFERAVQNVHWNEVNPEQAKIFNQFVSGNVLDVGCGYGRAIPLLKTDVDYIGIEITPAFIEEAKARYPSNRFLLQDARKMTFDDNSFDWGLAIGIADSIYWPEIKKEMQRVCKKILILRCEQPKEYEII